MKVAITSAGSYDELRRRAEHAFKLLGYKDIFSFQGSECKENNVDIICIIASANFNRSNGTYYIRLGFTCTESRDFKDKHNEAIVCMYVEETNTIYRAVYSYNPVDSLESHILVSTVPLEGVVLPVAAEKRVKPDAYYLSESSSIKALNYLEKKFPYLCINYYTCDISKTSFPNLQEEDLVFLDFKENKFLPSLTFDSITWRDNFRKLISRKNTFLMYEPAYERCKVPYKVKSATTDLSVTIKGIYNTTKDIYELIEKSVKKPVKESLYQTGIPDKPLNIKCVKPTNEQVREYIHRDIKYVAGFDYINDLKMSSDRVFSSILALWNSTESETAKPNNVLLLKNKKR
jgi:hypothetical protein